jgi:mono/diheme cytochrome c family protein
MIYRVSLPLLCAFAICSHAAEQPLTPGGKWRAHDMARPQPEVVTPAPPGAPVPPPSDAIILFDGKDLSRWTREPRRGDPDASPEPKWKIENGYMEIVPASGTLRTKDKFGDSQWHIEWATPAEVKGDGQGRGNSGILLGGIVEVQVLDSYGNKTYPDGSAGSLYSHYPPLVNASRKPGEWQTYDLVVEVAKLDAKGQIARPARVTVFHNGVLVQHAAEIPESRVQEFTLGLQDHLNPGRYRNIWVRKLKDYDSAQAPSAKEEEKPQAKTETAHPFVTPALGGFDEGEHLIATLNCTSCHAASGLAPDRIAAKKSPILGPDGLKLSPQFLRDYLTSPQHDKPGTTMPDMLHALPPAEKTAAVDSLVHYLLSLSQVDDRGAAPSEDLIAKGKALYHEVGCVACHASQDSKARELAATSAPLGNLARKFTVAQLAEFLQQPSKFRPSRRMPSLNLKKDEAMAVAMYLLRAQASGGEGAGTTVAKGLRYEYFAGEVKDCGPALENLKPTQTGSIDDIDVARWAKKDTSFAVRFTGTFNLETAGQYSFFTVSDDGSRLWIDGQEIVNNDGSHPKIEKIATATLNAGEHSLMLTYFQRAKTGWALEAGFGQTGMKMKPLMKAASFTHSAGAMRPIGNAEFKVDATKAARGKTLFGELGCAQCHPGIGSVPAAKFAAKSLFDLKPNGGCLASQPSGKAPDFHLSPAQTAAIQRTLGDTAKLKQPLAPAQEIVRTMNFLNCYACHSRDGIGGPEGARATYFKGAGEVDLGDEGRMPPHLTKVGAKLRTEWIGDVLLRKGAVRPYMLTRMPQFSPPVVEKLPETFAKADGATPIPPEPAYDRKIAEPGRWLVGTTGYSCIACHTFGKYPSLGVPAIDLTTMTKRLRPDWFARYLPDPVALRPGTRMPSFWPGGVAANKTELGGDTAEQIAAIWMFLTKGSAADAPPGLIRAKMELSAERDAVVYRNFIEGAGSRAIGVGYPEKANLAFDANDLRLALLWQGSFIDAGRHRTGRGAGFEAPLGSNLLKLPAGPAFAILASETSPWPGTSEGARFHGYSLDAKQRPLFRYEVAGVKVEDFPEAVPDPREPSLKRTLTLHAAQAVTNLYFRAGAGAKIEEKDGAFVIDGRLRVKLPGAQATVRRIGDTSELLVPIVFRDGTARLIEEIAW